jgi:hypothetical protein
MADAETKTYRVIASPDAEAGDLLTDFSFPWKEYQAPSTKFRARWTPEDQRLHFSFDVEDGDIVLGEGEDSKTQVIGSDRVELFFSCDESLSRYYALEMDPRGVVLDYAAKFHREMDWQWSIDDLELETEMREDGYSVAGSLSLDELNRLGCLHTGADGGRYLIAGAYRAEFHRDTEGKVIEDWIAWVDPQVTTPDFHVPSSFGRFLLAE